MLKVLKMLKVLNERLAHFAPLFCAHSLWRKARP
jgi:hypothetical protein